jgi:hypothetical protein
MTRLTLDKHSLDIHYRCLKLTRSVRQVAKLVNIDPQTLYKWIWDGTVVPSVVVPLDGRKDGRKLYRFTDSDIRKLRRYKAAHYWEGRGGRRKET